MERCAQHGRRGMRSDELGAGRRDVRHAGVLQMERAVGADDQGTTGAGCTCERGTTSNRRGQGVLRVRGESFGRVSAAAGARWDELVDGDMMRRRSDVLVLPER